MPFSRLMHQWHIHVVSSPLVFESTLLLYPLRAIVTVVIANPDFHHPTILKCMANHLRCGGHPATGPTCGFWAYLYSSLASLSYQDLRMSLSVSNLILFITIVLEVSCDAQEFNFKNQSRATGDAWLGEFAVAHLCRDVNLPLVANMHLLDGDDPALNEVAKSAS